MNRKQGEDEEKQPKVLIATVTADPVRIQNVPRYTITHVCRKNNVKRMNRYPAKQKRTCTLDTTNQLVPEVGPHSLHCIWLTWVQWPPPSRPRNSFQTTASERRCRGMASWEKDVPQTGSNKENMRGREELESMWWYCAQSAGQSGGECAVRGVRERERQRTTPLLKGLTWRKKAPTHSHTRVPPCTQTPIKLPTTYGADERLAYRRGQTNTARTHVCSQLL